MLLELSKVEQRYDAVMAILRDGLRVTEVAEKFGVHRDTLYVWMRRYEEGGIDALAERSHRPRSSPLQMEAAVEAHVLELRRVHPYWGPASIAHRLARDGVEPVPSLSGIYRALRRAGLVEAASRRKVLPTYKRWERGTTDGAVAVRRRRRRASFATAASAKVLTGVDDHSRFCVSAGVMAASDVASYLRFVRPGLGTPRHP